MKKILLFSSSLAIASTSISLVVVCNVRTNKVKIKKLSLKNNISMIYNNNEIDSGINYYPKLLFLSKNKNKIKELILKDEYKIISKNIRHNSVVLNWINKIKQDKPSFEESIKNLSKLKIAFKLKVFMLQNLIEKNEMHKMSSEKKQKLEKYLGNFSNSRKFKTKKEYIDKMKEIKRNKNQHYSAPAGVFAGNGGYSGGGITQDSGYAALVAKEAAEWERKWKNEHYFMHDGVSVKLHGIDDIQIKNDDMVKIYWSNKTVHNKYLRTNNEEFRNYKKQNLIFIKELIAEFSKEIYKTSNSTDKEIQDYFIEFIKKSSVVKKWTSFFNKIYKHSRIYELLGIDGEELMLEYYNNDSEKTQDMLIRMVKDITIFRKKYDLYSIGARQKIKAFLDKVIGNKSWSKYLTNAVSYLDDKLSLGNGVPLSANWRDQGINDFWYQIKNNYSTMVSISHSWSRDFRYGIVWRVIDTWWDFPELYISSQLTNEKYTFLSPGISFNFGNKISRKWR